MRQLRLDSAHEQLQVVRVGVALFLTSSLSLLASLTSSMEMM